jgi:hypothetical protein
MNSFKIFTPVKKFYVTNNVIVYGLAIISFLPALFEIYILGHLIQEVSNFSCFFGGVFGLLTFCTMLVFLIKHLQEYALMKGELKGNLVFNNDKIILNGTVIRLSEIENVSIPRFNDYLGKPEYRNKLDLDGVLSNGIDNKVEFLFKNGRKSKCYFQLTERYQIRDIREQLIAYYKAGKFDFDNLTIILGLENYNAIQNFKNTLSIKSY